MKPCRFRIWRSGFPFTKRAWQYEVALDDEEFGAKVGGWSRTMLGATKAVWDVAK